MIPDLTQDPRFLEDTLEEAARDGDQESVDAMHRCLLRLDPARAAEALARTG